MTEDEWNRFYQEKLYEKEIIMEVGMLYTRHRTGAYKPLLFAALLSSITLVQRAGEAENGAEEENWE